MKKSGPEKQSLLQQHDRDYLTRGFKSLAGVDEAGRGPLAGPVVASAVIVRDFSFLSRVDDSKKMSEKARLKAYSEILEKCSVGVGIVNVQEIDRINILEATLAAMRRAIESLEEIPSAILVDGPITPPVQVKKFAIVDGDALSFSIACASIVAKVTRDRLMNDYDKVYPGYGFSKHKGYGTRDHLSAIDALGPCAIHRRSFEPIKSKIGL